MWDKKHMMAHYRNIWYLLDVLTLASLNVDRHIRMSPLTKPQRNLCHWCLMTITRKIACYIPPPSWQMYKWCKRAPPYARCLHHHPHDRWHNGKWHIKFWPSDNYYSHQRHHGPMWVKWLTFSIAWRAPLGLFVGQTRWFWKCLGTILGHFLWAFTILWSPFLARVWSGPHILQEMGVERKIST